MKPEEDSSLKGHRAELGTGSGTLIKMNRRGFERMCVRAFSHGRINK